MASGDELTRDGQPQGQPFEIDVKQESDESNNHQAPTVVQGPHQEASTSGGKFDEKSETESDDVTHGPDKGKGKGTEEMYRESAQVLARHAQLLGIQGVFQIGDNKPGHESEKEPEDDSSPPRLGKGKGKAVEELGTFDLEYDDPDDLNLDDINIKNLIIEDLNIESIEGVEVETVEHANGGSVQHVENTQQNASSGTIPEATKFRILQTIQDFLTAMTTAPNADARQHMIETGFTFSSTPGEFQYYTLDQAIWYAQLRKERGARPKFNDNEVRQLVRQNPEPEVFLRDRIAAVWCRVRQYDRIFHAMTSDAVCLFTLYKVGLQWKICSVVSSQLHSDRPTYKYAPELQDFLGALSDIYLNHTWDDLAQYHLKNAMVIEYNLASPGAYPLRASYVRALAPKMKAWVKELEDDGRESRLDMQLSGPEIRICGEMGFVWTQVVFLLNGQVKCMSIDSMTFLKSGNRWLVTGIASLGLD